MSEGRGLGHGWMKEGEGVNQINKPYINYIYGTVCDSQRERGLGGLVKVDKRWGKRGRKETLLGEIDACCSVQMIFC